ncbi:MAG: hypothetical protein NTX03_07850 [Bacteroidetes bacterium]|nr:hypothetical protein [Bacteroidota bacterium]
MKNKVLFVDGLENGGSVYYREDGSKLYEGDFKNGNRDGEWKYYDENGKVIKTTIFKIDFEIKEAKIFIRLPNDEWFLNEKSDTGLVQYFFKRDQIIAQNGSAIIPVITLYIEDAKSYKQNIEMFSSEKKMQFGKKSLVVNKVITSSDKDFPLRFENSMILKTSYTENSLNHTLYMAYIITKDNKGIQLYMDAPKDIDPKYEKELWTSLQSIKELR